MCECIFILLNVFSVGLGVDNETSFLMESFKLTAFSFHFTEFGCVQRRSAIQGDGFCLKGCKLVQCVVVEVDEFGCGLGCRGIEVESFSVRRVVSVDGSVGLSLYCVL